LWKSAHDSPSATFFAYDPSGVSTVSGAANSFPLLYHGLEHEVTDPGQLYFEPSGNVYNPQLQRELSQVGPQGLSAPNGGFGPGHHAPGGQGENTIETINDLVTVGAAFPVFSVAGLETPSFFSNPFSLVKDIEDILSLFNHGGGGYQKPYQLDHGRNQNWGIVGIADGLTPTQKSAKCKCPTAPVLPKGESLNDNIRASQQHSKAWFAWKEWPSHAWDFKQYGSQYDAAGNFNYGACGRAAGFSNYTLLNAGAQLQKRKGTYQSGNGVPFITSPYGENKAAIIRDGERYYDCGCYK
jgi:hypothetical protein